MKIRFLALLLILGAASATVLIYAARSMDTRSAATLGAASDECSSCAMMAQPAVATLANAGCPYDATATSTVAASESRDAPSAMVDAACCNTVATAAPAH